MIDEDEELVKFMREGFEKLIEEAEREVGVDMGYFDFKVVMISRNVDFVDDSVIKIRDYEKLPCAFCGKPTRMYVKEQDMFMCAECYGKYVSGRTKV